MDLMCGGRVWHLWEGVTGAWYARLPRSSPPVVLREAELEDCWWAVTRWDGRLS